MNIIIHYDQSALSSAPAAFFSAVQYVVNSFDALISDDVTITINFGWGEVGGQSLVTPGADPSRSPYGESQSNRDTFSYSDVRFALLSAATTYDDLASAAALPVSDPTNGGKILVTAAQAQALGLTSLQFLLTGGFGGSVGISSVHSFTFDPNNRAVPGEVDGIGVLFHEISEVLGRTSNVTNPFGSLTIYDLFRYSAPGVHTRSESGAWFSADSLNLLAPFNDVTGGDAGDWAPTIQRDAFLAFAPVGQDAQFTTNDFRVLDVMGFHMTGPGVTGISPVQGFTTVSTWPRITIRFDEAILSGFGNIVIHNASDGSVNQTIDINDSSRVFIQPHGVLIAYLPFYLDFNRSYYITLDQGLVTDTEFGSFGGMTADAANEFTTPTAANEVASWFISVLRSPNSLQAVSLEQSLVSGLDSGATSQPTALTKLLNSAEATTSVATLAYQFFTGKVPGAAGMDYLVSPSGPNPNNLNSGYFQSFNIENRYINFAVNLGKFGAGNVSFAAQFDGLNLFDATKRAYGEIFGVTPSDTKVHALLDPLVSINGHTGSRADYFASYGGDGPDGIGTKAAMVGWLLAEAALADVGSYAKSNDAFLTDVALHGASFGVDMIGSYNQADFAFNGG